VFCSIGTTNHRQENKAKIKLTHLNLTSQILPVLKEGVFAVFYCKIQIFGVYFKTALDLNNINYLCLASDSSKYHP
jgi:hypothetical protein